MSCERKFLDSAIDKDPVATLITTYQNIKSTYPIALQTCRYLTPKESEAQRLFLSLQLELELALGTTDKQEREHRLSLLATDDNLQICKEMLQILLKDNDALQMNTPLPNGVD